MQSYLSLVLIGARRGLLGGGGGGGRVSDKGTMYRSLTIGSPLCSLSVGEPGDPGCGDVDWNTEGETDKVTLLTLIVYCQV